MSIDAQQEQEAKVREDLNMPRAFFSLKQDGQDGQDLQDGGCSGIRHKGLEDLNVYRAAAAIPRKGPRGP